MSDEGIMDLTTTTGWSDCPTDVLILIFKQLDGKSLVNCMGVNGWWRDVVDYVGQHHGLWPDIAQAGMLNKGLTFRNKSSLAVNWRDLYINSQLWRHVDSADVTWAWVRFQGVKTIQSIHIYKDIFIVGHGPELRMTYYRMQNVFQGHDAGKGKDPIARALGMEAIEDSDHNCTQDMDEYDLMEEKILKEVPFMKYIVFDDKCFYVLDDRNVMRRYVWNKEENNWTDEVLGRYYGCARSIKDIHVFDGDVYLLLKTGYVMRADRSGRNFENASVFNFPPHSLTFFMRLFRSNLLKSIETVFVLNIPEYCTSPNVMFHRFSVVVAAPSDKEFKVNYQKGADQVVIECPDLTSALEHGEILFLGYKDGRVDICKPKNLIANDGKPELSVNVGDCEACTEDDRSIVGLEVYEAKESHCLFVATHTNVYRLEIKYPAHVKNSIDAIKREI